MSFLANSLPGIRVFVVTSVVEQLHGWLWVVLKKKEEESHLECRCEGPQASHSAGGLPSA